MVMCEICGQNESVAKIEGIDNHFKRVEEGIVNRDRKEACKACISKQGGHSGLIIEV